VKRPNDPRPNPHLTDADLDLFRNAVRDAVPLPPRDRLVPQRRSAPAVPVQSLLDEHDALAESIARPLDPESALETGEEASYVSEGVSRQVLRKLRRGHWVVQAEVDLHGLRRVEARLELARFLRECIGGGLRCVRVIHGKGLGSKNREPVLKLKVRAWLVQRSEVLAFCQAPAVQGGGGALLVLLRG
jgi:DNA-nicking Smr family endonuclease